MTDDETLQEWRSTFEWSYEVFLESVHAEPVIPDTYKRPLFETSREETGRFVIYVPGGKLNLNQLKKHD